MLQIPTSLQAITEQETCLPCHFIPSADYSACKNNGVKKKKEKERIIFSELNGKSYLEAIPYDIFMKQSKNYNKLLASRHF